MISKIKKKCNYLFKHRGAILRKSISKGLKNKKDELGQFNTSQKLTDQICSLMNIKNNSVIIEPSFGSGNFLQSIKKKIKNYKEIIGIEIDPDVFKKIKGVKTINKNFYDFKFSNIDKNDYFVFIGNPPYRTPAISLKTHKKLVETLFSLYHVKGIKEEAVIFLLYTYHLFKTNSIDGEIHYILPKTIFFNPTPMFRSFYNFLRKNLKIVKLEDVDQNNFEGVNQDLVFASFKVDIEGKSENYKFFYNKSEKKFDDFIGEDVNTISYKKIFKKTYLGSVPAESFLLSCKNESLDNFKERICKIFDTETKVTESNLIELLSYNGEPHLQALKNKNPEKIKTVLAYIEEIKNNKNIDKNIFLNSSNYKPIVHRKESRFYFRHESLKKVSFIYIINSKPTKSFFFTCNPNKISSDYFGYCDYDVNRNSSPGGIRTVPIKGIENNLTENFKIWWDKNSNGLPYTEVFEYLLYISKSEWYKEQKKKYNKMYFGIPKIFDKNFKKLTD